MTEKCGAETTKGRPCQNDADTCPWHNTDNPPDNGRPTKLSHAKQEAIAADIEQGRSMRSAARMAGITPQTVLNWLDRGEDETETIYADFFERFQDVWYDEYDHSAHCSKIKGREYSGKDSWNWKNNARSYRGPNWHRQRKKALERADYKCENCAETDKEHRKRHDYGLHVHHIIARRNFADDDPEQNALENLCVLCHQCHEMYEGSNLSPVQRGSV